MRNPTNLLDRLRMWTSRPHTQAEVEMTDEESLTAIHRQRQQKHEFELHMEFDALLGYPEAREFESAWSTAFAMPPFISGQFRVNPSIPIPGRPSSNQALPADTSSKIVVKGQLNAADEGTALQTISQSSYLVWFEFNSNPMTTTSLDGKMKVILNGKSFFLQHGKISMGE